MLSSLYPWGQGPGNQHGHKPSSHCPASACAALGAGVVPAACTRSWHPSLGYGLGSACSAPWAISSIHPPSSFLRAELPYCWCMLSQTVCSHLCRPLCPRIQSQPQPQAQWSHPGLLGMCKLIFSLLSSRPVCSPYINTVAGAVPPVLLHCPTVQQQLIALISLTMLLPPMPPHLYPLPAKATIYSSLPPVFYLRCRL